MGEYKECFEKFIELIQNHSNKNTNSHEQKSIYPIEYHSGFLKTKNTIYSWIRESYVESFSVSENGYIIAENNEKAYVIGKYNTIQEAQLALDLFIEEEL